MKVSVVIPCRNAAPYLAQAIGSALDQTRPPAEIVVVDDGSTDESLEIAARFETAEGARVRVFSEPSGRASRTRNLGALAATGDAVMFLDADDVIRPDTLEALASALSAVPDGIAACPWFRLEQIAGRWMQRPPSCAPRLRGQDALHAWLTGWYYPPCAVLWSRAAFEQAGRWDERAAVNQDGDLMMRALACGTSFIETAGGRAWYRRLPRGEGSVSSTRSTRIGLVARIRALRKIAFWLQQRGCLDQYKTSLGAAFERIAVDAQGREADLWEEACAHAREYRHPLWNCAARWLPRGGVRAGGAASRSDVGLEVRCGLARAESVLRNRTFGGIPPPARSRRVERPAVTVIVPTFNRAPLLRRAVDSVLAQTFGDFELLIVDDGSTDGTAAVVAAYADPRIRFLRQPRNAGVSAARNRGLRAARGEFIAFLDSDDEWMPTKVARQVARFGEVPEQVGLIYTGVETVRRDGTTRVECSRARGDVYRDMLQGNVIHGGGSNVMIRREVVAAAGFFHEGLPAIEDYEYWLRVTRFFHVDRVDEPLIRYYDVAAAERRSLALAANLDARWWFYRAHVAEMRRAGVAHLFLLKTVRRALRAEHPDVRAARRLAARAVLEAPTSRMALATLGRAMLRRQ